jgi:RND family efflux transporter MFP subunit
LWNRHPEPSGSRRATPPLSFQHSPGQFHGEREARRWRGQAPPQHRSNVKATFANDEEALWPGQFVNVRVELDVRRNVVAVPVTAVQQGPDGTFAFVVGQDRKVQKRVIKVGEVNKTTAIIDGGIQTGDVVVTEGQYRVQAGTTVDVLGNPTASRTLAP